MAANGNVKQQRNVRSLDGWIFYTISPILIFMAMEFMWYQTVAASFGLKMFAFETLIE